MGDGASEPGMTGDLGAKAAHEYFEGDAYLANNPIIPIRARFVSELLSDLRNGSVLDLGCGDGSVSRGLLDSGNDLTLVDFSEAMLRRAQESEPRSAVGRVRYVHSDILEWSAERSYDAVLCIGLLALSRRPSAPWSSLRRQLNQGGGVSSRSRTLAVPSGGCSLVTADCGNVRVTLLTSCLPRSCMTSESRSD